VNLPKFKELRPAVFLDRDGTLIEDRGHLSSPDEVRFFSATIGALQRLREDFLFFLVTNQSGVAEGLLTLEQVERVNAYVVSALAKVGLTITATYVCPHHRRDSCQCIKPNPHFLNHAADQYGIDLKRSFTVGDHPHDIELAKRAGAQGVFVCTGHGWMHVGELAENQVVVPDIRAAAEWILARCLRSRQLAGSESRIADAAGTLRGGGIVAFPTETVYGLGANAFDRAAVQRVFEIKNRPHYDPLIVHVSHARQVEDLVLDFPAEARVLARRFWPGPLTLVLPKIHGLPDLVTAGLPTVAIRVPNHALALALLEEVGCPVAAPSANPFGMLSPTTAEHVRDQLGDQVDLILDGGPCAVGVESTIVSFCGARPTLLRPGGIAAEDLEAVLGPLVCPPPHEPVPLAPGRLPRHYAPRTPLVLCSEVPAVPDGQRVGLLCLTRPPDAGLFAAVEALSEAGDLTQAAANLFAALRRLDALGLDLIFARPVPENGLGATIMDRLRKASSPPQPASQ